MAQYLLELALVDYKLLQYKSSLKAASALYLSDKILKQEIEWNEVVEKIGYPKSELKNCSKDLMILMQLSHKSTLTAVRKKFNRPKYLLVSKIKVSKK